MTKDNPTPSLARSPEGPMGLGGRGWGWTEAARFLPGGMQKPSAPTSCHSRAVQPTGEGTSSPVIYTPSPDLGLHTPSQRPKASQTTLKPFFLGRGEKTPPPPYAGSGVQTQPFAWGLRGGIRTWKPSR